MGKIVIVSELFYPDGTSTAHIMTKIADELYKTHEVVVLAGPESYSSDNITTTKLDEDKPYPIKRIKIGNLDKNKTLSRALKFVQTSMSLAWLLKKIAHKDDDVFIVTNPAPFLLLATILRQLKKFRLTILVHDVFPENTIAAGIIKSSNNLLYRFAKSIFRKAYSKADRLILIGRDMKQHFENKLKEYTKKPEFVVIENWADIVEKKGTFIDRGSDNITILYAGNIGRCQGLEEFLDEFIMADNINLRFELRGGGALAGKIETIIRHTGTDNIKLGGSYSRDEQFEILQDCDIALVTLADGMLGLGVPSKSYNIMAAGKPILFIGDENSEIAKMVNEHEIGYCFSPNDRTDIIEWLKTLDSRKKAEFNKMGEKARRLADTIYSEETILNKYNELFKKY